MCLSFRVSKTKTLLHPTFSLPAFFTSANPFAHLFVGMDWSWKERFPRQPEVEQYLNRITDFLDLRKDIILNTRIAAAHRDENTNTWVVTTGKQILGPRSKYLPPEKPF